jgi:hypothetical protein
MLTKRNPGIVLAPLAYGLLLSLADLLFARLWLVGGILLTAAAAACASSGLYLLENLVRRGTVTLSDFFTGFSVYLGEVLTIAFILWIPMMLLARVALTTPQGAFLWVAVNVILYVLLNAVPELIYQSRISGLALLSASYEFIVANWLEWFVPNILIATAGYLLIPALNRLAVSLPDFLALLFVASAFGLFVAFFMIFRGVLFAELSGSTRRSRLFRYRARAD